MLSNDVMIEKVINGHRYLQFKRLLELGVNHCFTENDLNFSFKFQTEEENYQNIKIVCEDLGFNIDKICRPIQKHTGNIQKVTVYGLNPDEYDFTDALVTDEKDVPIGITTADCIPLIIYDPNKKVIANIHSGWRGTVKGIVESSIDYMISEYNCQENDLLFFFGPAICQDCYEVGPDVYDAFNEKFGPGNMKPLGQKDGENKYLLDNTGVCVDYLLKRGIKKDNIYVSNICTCHHKDKLHSYRARNEEHLGLNITIVTL